MAPQVLETLILILHVLASLAIIGLVLIQHGKGADMGSGFGGGSSGTVFGSGGAGNFLTKVTTGLAISFFLSSFALAYFAKQKSVTVRNIGVPEVVQQTTVTPDVELPALGVGSTESELPRTDDSDSGESEFPEG